jgi:hypothetical protein
MPDRSADAPFAYEGGGLRPAPRRGDRWRLFLAVWLLYSLHFSTNVVREHYPAFALIERGDFKVDAYHDLHSDIFRHRDGHYYIGNQVTGSVLAAVPLFLFRPVLDAVEAWERARPRPAVEPPKTSEYPNRRAFLEKVRARGLALRLGVATVVTSLAFTAPLAAAMVVSLFAFLVRRRLSRVRACALALLFAFATPIFYRASHLNHNLVLAASVWWGYLLLAREESDPPLSAGRRAAAGFCAGLGPALDYAGAITFAALGLLLLRPGGRRGGLGGAIREVVPFALGAVIPIGFLLFSQWTMYGDPFRPGQYWMPDVHFTERGFRGFDLPAPDLFLNNLFHPDWGLFPFAPILLGLLWPPVWRRREGPPLFVAGEKVFIAGTSLAFLLFCAANQYSRMQWNTGFRYLLPLLPFLFLVVAPCLASLRTGTLALLGVPCVLHQWVLCMARFTPVDWSDSRDAITESWRRILTGGPELPALETAAQSFPGLAWLGDPLLALVLVLLAAALALLMLRPILAPRRAEPA